METTIERRKYDFDSVVRMLLGVAGVLAAILVINYLSGILLPFAVGCLLAYMLEPCVKWLKRVLRVKGRMLPAVIAMLAFLGVIYLLLVFAVPYMVSEIATMGKLLTRYATKELSATGLPPQVQQWIGENLNPEAISQLLSKDQWAKLAQSVMNGTWTVVGGTLSVIGTAASWLFALIYMFFVMIDYDKVSQGFRNAVPERYRATTMRIVDDVTDTMSRYFRGQALVSLCVGVIFAIEFSIIGLPMAVVFGLTIGMMNMVPYLQLVSIPFAAFLCLVQSVATGAPFWPIAGWTFAAYCICQALQDLLITPLIMKQQMGLRPAVIFLSLSIWGYVLGFIGLIIALPLTTLIVSYYSELVLHQPNPLHHRQPQEPEQPQEPQQPAAPQQQQ